MTPSQVAAEALRQVRDGRDFPPLAQVLSRVKPEEAARIPEGFKYSLITLAEHTWFWQDIWIRRLKGQSAPSFMKDWRGPSPSEWNDVRKRLIDGLDEAILLAETQELDAKAIGTLLQIAIHDAYHVGQFVLIKRALSRKD